MEELAFDAIRTDLNKLGIYQVAGGFLGMVLLIINLISIPHLIAQNGLFVLLVLLFFSYSIYCGILCFLKKGSALGHSLVNQLLQLLNFTIGGLLFGYSAGIFISIGLDLTHFLDFSFDAGISRFVSLYSPRLNQLEISINLVALAIIYWIEKIKKRVRQEAAIR
ncbi:MAG: hypothetical protein KGM98_06525, partial [Bacteroidota bacterium]|nr:hypothetical protein [Bacteroidota bacterium]